MTDNDVMEKDHNTAEHTATPDEADVPSNNAPSSSNETPITVAEIVDDCTNGAEGESSTRDHFDTKTTFIEGDARPHQDSNTTNMSAATDRVFFFSKYVHMLSPGIAMVVVLIIGLVMMLLAHAVRPTPQERTAPLSPAPSVPASSPSPSPAIQQNSRPAAVTLERIQIKKTPPKEASITKPTTDKALAIAITPRPTIQKAPPTTPPNHALPDATHPSPRTKKSAIPAALSAQLEHAQKRLDAQERQIAELTLRLNRSIAAQQKQSAHFADIVENRLVQLQAAKAPPTSQSAAAALAFHDLHQQIGTGHSFDAQLVALEALLPGSDALRDLKLYAATGLPTLHTLQTSFASYASRSVLEKKRSSAKNILGHIEASFTSMISIRKTNATADNTLARAQRSLEAGDLDNCLKELDALQGATRTAMIPWITDAQTKMHAEHLLADIKKNIITNTTNG